MVQEGMKGFYGTLKVTTFLYNFAAVLVLPILSFYENEHISLMAFKSQVIQQNKLRQCRMRDRSVLVGNRGMSLPMEAATCKEKLT